jgi:hypothetical protein
VEELAGVAELLLEHGVGRILVEKPGALDRQDISRAAALARAKGAEVLIAYDRRFYAATLRVGGTPVELATFTAGAFAWHPAASAFAGAGRTDRDVLFSYHSNWAAPGRWGLEVLTSKHRLIFRPLRVAADHAKRIGEGRN